MRFQAGSGWEQNRYTGKPFVIVSGTLRPSSITVDPDSPVAFFDDSRVELLDGGVVVGDGGDGPGPDVDE